MVITDIQKFCANMGLALVAALAIFGGLYHIGAEAGRSETQAVLDDYKLTEAKQLAAVQAVNASAELRHRQETATIEDQLRKSEASHEATVAAVRADYAVRLRTSDDRAAVYRRMSEAGPAACADLGDHAAGLDGALETGVSLVGELQAALGQREDQLRALGAVILNDRQLVGEAK